LYNKNKENSGNIGSETLGNPLYTSGLDACIYAIMRHEYDENTVDKRRNAAK
jgi:hypothetical protein